MIVWLNGSFGAGKTTTSGHLVSRSERLRHFDPEWIGYMLANNLADHAVTDFQQYPSWRRLRHVEIYQAARAWLRRTADLVVDTVDLDAPMAAEQIHAAVAERL